MGAWGVHNWQKRIERVSQDQDTQFYVAWLTMAQLSTEY